MMRPRFFLEIRYPGRVIIYFDKVPFFPRPKAWRGKVKPLCRFYEREDDGLRAVARHRIYL